MPSPDRLVRAPGRLLRGVQKDELEERLHPQDAEGQRMQGEPGVRAARTAEGVLLPRHREGLQPRGNGTALRTGGRAHHGRR